MAFAPYANSGPFVNNTVPPGINATFLNNVENFLDQIIASIVADSHVTANGAGAVTVVSVTATGTGTGLSVSHNAVVSGTLTVSGAVTASGIITASGGVKGLLTNIGGAHTLIDFNFGTVAATPGGVAVTHGLKNASGTSVVPGAILVTPNSGVGTVTATAGGVTTTQFTVFSSTNISCWWLALL